MGLFAKMVNKFQLECLQELQPSHLMAGQLVLCLQVLKWFIIGDHTCALAIDIVAPFLDGNDSGHQLTLMGGVVCRCSSQFLAIACHWLQPLACILLYNTPMLR